MVGGNVDVRLTVPSGMPRALAICSVWKIRSSSVTLRDEKLSDLGQAQEDKCQERHPNLASLFAGGK
jgi:hypothetical protein